MRYKLTLQQKIITIVIGFSLIVYSFAIGYISISARNAALSSAKALITTAADKYAANIKILLEEDLVYVQGLANTARTFAAIPKEKRQENLKKIYYESIVNSSQFLAVWDSWEKSHVDSSYNLQYGRYVNEYWRAGQKIEYQFSEKSKTGDPVQYGLVKQRKRESVEEPYFYSYTGSDFDKQLMTSIIVPLMVNNSFWGVVGVDISLERFNTIINQIKPFDGSYAMLVSHGLIYVAHPDKEKLAVSVLDDYNGIFDNNELTEKLANGESAIVLGRNSSNESSYFTFSPIIIGNTQTPWILSIVVPKSTLVKHANKTLIISLLVGLLGLIALTLVAYYATIRVFKPIYSLTTSLRRLALGHVAYDMKLKESSNDEVGQMAIALNTSIDGLTEKVNFAINIGKGNLESEFNLLSDEDILGKALIDMRASLKHARDEEEKRKKEDEKRQWTNEGLATFAELLRQNNDNLELLSKAIIRELIGCLNANQGGLFLFNDDDSANPHFELVAAFAYNRHKYNKKTILLGEGLVGASALERKITHLTEIPDGYIEITSGLGASKPTALLIVPLLIEDKVLGAIELASLNAFEDFEIEFVERVAQSIALTITSVRINIRTSQLLAKTQQQAEEMQAQEEEMRQNMEELQATQEESFRKSGEMQSFIDALNNSSFVIEYDPLGYITAINNAYLELLGLTRDEVVGLHHSDKMDMDASTRREYDQFWSDLRLGIPRRQTSKFVVNGKTFVFQETYTPIKNDQGEVYKILKISNNITNLMIH